MAGKEVLLRNPLFLGIVLFAQSLILTLVFVLVLLPYYERIIAAEDVFLLNKFDADYNNWP